MTKTLTEQWREGTLPLGTYYILNINGVEEIDKSIAIGELWNNTDLKEVLAPVPSYEEYKKLQKKLEIAIKALKDIDVRSQRDWNEYDCMGCAKKALYDIEMEGVK